MWTSRWSTGYRGPGAREDDRLPVDYRGGGGTEPAYAAQMEVRWNPWNDRLGVGPRWPW